MERSGLSSVATVPTPATSLLRSSAKLIASPLALGWLFVGLLTLGLSLPLVLPIGPNYWDITVYFDGAHRIAAGQVPHRDFFAPVGGLSYLLYHLIQSLFPSGHPLLAIQWSIVPLALPPVMIVAHHLARAGLVRQSLGLLLPFLLFLAAPINGLELYPAPGFDAYGSYNRHQCILLYSLMATLWLHPGGWSRSLWSAALLLALIGIKLTGFLVGAAFIVHAAVAGRLTLRQFTGVALLVAGALGVLELSMQIVSSYFVDIVKLVGTNSGSLLGRFFTVASVDFDVIAAGGLLTLVLLLLTWPQLSGTRILSWAFVQRLADSPAVRVGVTLFGGILLETQNTGSQEFIFLWPLLLPIVAASWTSKGKGRSLILGLVLVTFVPHVTKIVHRSMRATMSAFVYHPLPAKELGALGRVNAKRDMLERTDVLLQHYVTHRSAYEFLAQRDQLPSAILFSELDYQLAWLKSIDAAVIAFRAHEARTGVHYNSIYTLDFADVFPAILNRTSPLHVPIGLDPYRTFPAPDAEIIAEVKTVDAILVPHCPVTHPRRIIAQRFAQALEGRQVIALTDCWTLHVRN